MNLVGIGRGLSELRYGNGFCNRLSRGMPHLEQNCRGDENAQGPNQADVFQSPEPREEDSCDNQPQTEQAQ